MKSQWKVWSGYLGFVFLLASCAPSAHIEKDDNADFTQYKTFTWVRKDKLGKKNARSEKNDLQNKRSGKLSPELEKSGWKETKG